MAAALALLGLIMTFAPDSAYTSPAFRWTFYLMSRQQWGVTFLVLGVLTAVDNPGRVGRLAGGFLTFATAVYGITSACATISGDALSGSGWIWPCMAAVVLALVRPNRVSR